MQPPACWSDPPRGLIGDNPGIHIIDGLGFGPRRGIVLVVLDESFLVFVPLNASKAIKDFRGQHCCVVTAVLTWRNRWQRRDALCNLIFSVGIKEGVPIGCCHGGSSTVIA